MLCLGAFDKVKTGKLSDQKLCLVCSSGGHLFQLTCLDQFWKNKSRFWVSFPTQDAKYLLAKENVYWANYPTNRNVVNLIKNLILAFRVILKEKPSVVITTGAGVGIPFLFVGRIMGSKTVYLESITRNNDLSLSGKLAYRFVHKFLVQWPELAERYAKAEYRGKVI